MHRDYSNKVIFMIEVNVALQYENNAICCLFKK